ncbi:MAG: hypothetical protein D6750_11445 [Bacteroidetes bacterium]|nr:MAG: hypothetical protein D6750_11445 [Bacteroidota bacterium]
MTTHAQTDRPSVYDALKQAVAQALKSSAHTLFFYPIPSVPARGVRVEISSATAAVLSEALARVALENSLQYEVLSETTFTPERVVVKVSVRFATLHVQRVGEASLAAVTTGTGEMKQNDAAVRTAETRAFKRALEALTGEVLGKWLQFAEQFAMRHIAPANAEAERSPSRSERTIVFSNALSRLFTAHVAQLTKQE